MADTPAPSPRSSGSFSARMTKKVGPLPVWAWAIIALVVGYYLYKKYQASSSSSATGTTPASESTPIPNGDQSGGGVGSASGSSGTTTPTTPPDTTPVGQPETKHPIGINTAETNAEIGNRTTTPINNGGTFFSPGIGTPNTGGSVKVSGGRLTA